MECPNISQHIHDQLQTGMKMPSGNFTLPLNHQHPLALIARGVGITLVLSLLETPDKQDAQNMPSVTLLYTNRNGHSHAFRGTPPTLF